MKFNLKKYYWLAESEDYSRNWIWRHERNELRTSQAGDIVVGVIEPNPDGYVGEVVRKWHLLRRKS